MTPSYFIAGPSNNMWNKHVMDGTSSLVPIVWIHLYSIVNDSLQPWAQSCLSVVSGNYGGGLFHWKEKLGSGFKKIHQPLSKIHINMSKNTNKWSNLQFWSFREKQSGHYVNMSEFHVFHFQNHWNSFLLWYVSNILWYVSLWIAQKQENLNTEVHKKPIYTDQYLVFDILLYVSQ